MIYVQMMLSAGFPGPHHQPPPGQQIPALQTRHGHLHREPLRWSSVLQVGDLSE